MHAFKDVIDNLIEFLTSDTWDFLGKPKPNPNPNPVPSTWQMASSYFYPYLPHYKIMHFII
ncbi:hypothetical protein G9F72_010635 [Clostridium estertheticum]|uniref:hypothetical protein n=1 Tax=Clostridium estertheticum TaxID=238834 RepID=UPI0013E933F9|nr:hypothetical protein [Clostridium estertheticum]MBZ9686781.1 hypothetical protein [Clostridium estertheticum]